MSASVIAVFLFLKWVPIVLEMQSEIFKGDITIPDNSLKRGGEFKFDKIVQDLIISLALNTRVHFIIFSCV